MQAISSLAAIALLIASADSLLLGLAPQPRVQVSQILMQVGRLRPNHHPFRHARIQWLFAPAQTDDVPGDVEEMAPAAAVMAPVFEADDTDEGSIAKQALMAEMSGGLGGAKPDKAAIGEILLALEARNPTPSPATSTRCGHALP